MDESLIGLETGRDIASGKEICAICGEPIAHGGVQVETINDFDELRFCHLVCWEEYQEE